MPPLPLLFPCFGGCPGSEVELKPGGHAIHLTAANAHEYVDLVIQARLNESKRQVRGFVLHFCGSSGIHARGCC